MLCSTHAFVTIEATTMMKIRIIGDTGVVRRKERVLHQMEKVQDLRPCLAWRVENDWLPIWDDERYQRLR